MRFRLFSIILFLFVLAQATGAQSRYNFFTMGTAQGLSSNDIWSINEDKYGFIWVGKARGLNRFDGHSVKKYFHSEDCHATIIRKIILNRWHLMTAPGHIINTMFPGGLAKTLMVRKAHPVHGRHSWNKQFPTNHKSLKSPTGHNCVKPDSSASIL